MTFKTPSLALATAMLALAGCGGSSAPPADTAADTTGGASAQAGALDVALSEWAVDPAQADAAAGPVEFMAVNDGDLPHELEVVKTDTKAADLPVKDGVAQVNESDVVGSADDIGPGAEKPLSADLKPGHYVLICNLPSHYEQGMHADFEVK
jgi:uncharacterized cupredoxin-like copper-binding protein